MLPILVGIISSAECYRKYVIRSSVQGLSYVAKDVGCSIDDLLRLNPELKSSSVSLNSGYVLTVPSECTRDTRIYNDNPDFEDDMFAVNGSITLSFAWMAGFTTKNVKDVQKIWREARDAGHVDKYGYPFNDEFDKYAAHFDLKPTACTLFTKDIVKFQNSKNKNYIYCGEDFWGDVDPSREYSLFRYNEVDRQCYN